MSIKIIFLTGLFLLFLLIPFPVNARRATEVDVFQISDGPEREDYPVVYRNLILYSDGNGDGFDIYQYNTRTGVTSPVLVKPGQQFLNGYNGRFVLYTEYVGDEDPANPYDLRAYDVRRGRDLLVAGGPGAQMGGKIDGNKIVYVDGYGTGDLYVYDLSREASMLIDHNASVPRVSGEYVVWYSGTDIKLYNLREDDFVDIPNPEGAARSVPEIYDGLVVYYYEKDGVASIHLYDIASETERTLMETTEHTVNWPSVSKRYVVWSKETAPHTGGVEGINLKTGEIFEVYPQGNQQNAVMPPTIYGDTVAWMTWRTGNGDIYGANLHR